MLAGALRSPESKLAQQAPKITDNHLLRIEGTTLAQRPAGLAIDSARYATEVAKNIALLGMPNTNAGVLSKSIFEANREQIRAIQELYGLDKISLEYPIPIPGKKPNDANSSEQ